MHTHPISYATKRKLDPRPRLWQFSKKLSLLKVDTPSNGLNELPYSIPSSPNFFITIATLPLEASNIIVLFELFLVQYYFNNIANYTHTHTIHGPMPTKV